jgi:3-phenylpropionate/trans-cinnamate dioxygenase ferredoxin reductase component
MPDEQTFVIVGGGLAGGNAAVTLREEGFAGRIMLVGREAEPPFGRPPLSKTYLRGEEDLAGWRVRPAAWYPEHHVERMQDSVLGVDPAAHTLALASGAELAYDKVLIATGGRNRRLDLPGARLDGIHALRSVAESDAIRRAAAAGRTAVVVGMGFIGCEVAASLTQLGVRVTALFPGRAPLERVLGHEVAAVISAIHREHGVELRAGDPVARFEGAERVEAVVTAGGARVACDFVVVGVGIEPELPTFGGLSVRHADGGVLVDATCRAGALDVYAAGDVASHRHPLFGRVRVEHYNNAEAMGRAAARSMLGATDPYDYIHTFWSDQYEHKLEYVGHATTWDRFVVRGSLEERRFIGFYLQGGQVRAAVGLGRGGDPELDRDGEMAACARLVGARARPAAADLADDDVDLWSLAR